MYDIIYIQIKDKSMNLVTTQALEQATKITFVNADTYSSVISQDIADRMKFTGEYQQTLYLPEQNMVVVGTTQNEKIKHCDQWSSKDFYELGGAAVKPLVKSQIDTVHIEGLAENSDNPENDLMIACLGMMQTTWMFDAYLSKESSDKKDLHISVGEAEAPYVTEGFNTELKALYQGLVVTRSTIDEIPEKFNPSTAEGRIREELEEYDNVTINTLDQAQLEEKGMEALLSVNRSSRHDCVLTHVVLKPAGEVKQKIVLVGKGLTYDSGGLDIKYAGNMKTMKMDMGGAGTMFGVMKALAEIGLEHTEVHWMTGFAENMVGGDAYKADDILTSYSGQTIEVFHTDAEGRLTLADVLTYATLQDPDYIIDAATLTGASMRALSEHCTAMMGNDAELLANLEQSFVQEQEKTIQVQMPEVLRDQIKGDISDLRNLAKEAAMAGHITAGLFLSHFVDQRQFRNSELGLESPKGYAWAHLDIAGTAHNEGKNTLGIKGATGQSVRSLVRFIQKNDQ